MPESLQRAAQQLLPRVSQRSGAVARARSEGPAAAAIALRQALAGTVAAGLVLDARSGRVLATAGDVRSARSAPGATLEPFVLLQALDSGLVREHTVLPCRGTLMVGGRNLVCTHPRALHAFTAETALAYSCNEYFANVATRMTPAQLVRSLSRYGLAPAPGGLAALATPGARVLLALGLAGIRVSPQQMAGAYGRLAAQMYAGGDAAALETAVRPAREMAGRPALELMGRGLQGAVMFGMAYPAATAGLRLGGTLGTAVEPGQAWTHGWFAGMEFAADGRPEQIVVLFVPRGSGGDAALLAHRFFAAEQEQEDRR